MKKIAIPALIAAVGLSACAQPPESIAPVSMGNVYDRVSCGEARKMLMEENHKLAVLYPRQTQAVTGDALGVFLIGVPVSSLSGADLEGEISAAKGKKLSLEARLVSC